VVSSVFHAVLSAKIEGLEGLSAIYIFSSVPDVSLSNCFWNYFSNRPTTDAYAPSMPRAHLFRTSVSGNC